MICYLSRICWLNWMTIGLLDLPFVQDFAINLGCYILRCPHACFSLWHGYSITGVNFVIVSHYYVSWWCKHDAWRAHIKLFSLSLSLLLFCIFFSLLLQLDYDYILCFVLPLLFCFWMLFFLLHLMNLTYFAEFVLVLFFAF